MILNLHFGGTNLRFFMNLETETFDVCCVSWKSAYV